MIQSERFLAFVGAARGEGDPEGIYVHSFHVPSGTLQRLWDVTDVYNPSFLAVHPNGNYLYAIDEDRSESPSVGKVSAFSIDRATGYIKKLNTVRSHGQGLAHISTDLTGKYLFTAHYGGGSISVLPIQDDGRLGEATDIVQHEGSGEHPRQDGPHPHSIFIDPTNTFVFVPDLGLDEVKIYAFDAARGQFKPHSTPAIQLDSGSGPRHLAFHTKGQYMYVINELSSTITAFRYDAATGTAHELQTVSTLPKDFSGENTTAEILVHPSGKFLYGSNRGHDSICIYAIDEEYGTLSFLGHEPTRGGHPRNFAIDPTGTFLFAENRDDNNVVVFRIHEQSGLLQATGHEVEVPRPVCLKMVAMPSRGRN